MNTTMRSSFLVTIIFLLSSVYAIGAEGKSETIGVGYGKNTQGGAGGREYIVSNLRDKGHGSLRYTLNHAKRPAIIKFARCGTIELHKRLIITRGDLTIDGRGCKSGAGIQIKNYPVTLLNVQNVIITNIAFRLGTDAPMTQGQFSSSDPLEVQCSQDIVLDHLSIYWGTDENLSIYCYPDNGGKPATRISIQNTIIAEALRAPKKMAPRNTSLGLLITGAVYDVTLYRNLFVSNSDRNPSIYPEGFYPKESGLTRIQFINNVLYNTVYGLRTGRVNFPNWRIEIDVIGNYQKDALDNYLPEINEKPLFIHGEKSVQTVVAYLSDNITVTRPDSSVPEINIFRYGNNDVGVESLKAAVRRRKFALSRTPLTDIEQITIIPAKILEPFVLNNVGKIEPCRDPIDFRVIDNIRNSRPVSSGGQAVVDDPGDYFIDKWVCK